jgi:hypothetical protein
MTLPTWDQYMLPILKACADGKEHTMAELRVSVAKSMGLTPVQLDMLTPNGKQSLFVNRSGWAKWYLHKAKFLDGVRRGVFVIGQRGREILGFASTHAPLKVWVAAVVGGEIRVALSLANVATRSPVRRAPARPVPRGAVSALGVDEVPALHRLLRRAFQLSRSLPDELLHVFEKKVAGFPRTTEVQRLIVQRVGQDVFRAGLIEYWEGRCAITGFGVVELLRASHTRRGPRARAMQSASTCSMGCCWRRTSMRRSTRRSSPWLTMGTCLCRPGSATGTARCWASMCLSASRG